MEVILGFFLGAFTTWLCFKLLSWEQEAKETVVEEKKEDV